MKTFYLSFLLSVLSTFAFGQAKHFEILGTLKGDYSGKIYLFFDGNYRQRDSISSEIKNGMFLYAVVGVLPGFLCCGCTNNNCCSAVAFFTQALFL